MSSDRSAQATVEYAGCRCVVSETGMCGAMLGTEGEHAGVVYDFFASPYEDVRATYALMGLLLEQGASRLAVCSSTFLTSFFEQFGFEAASVLAASGAPRNWIPDVCQGSKPLACPDFVFMARRIHETSPSVTEWMSRGQHPPRPNARVDGRQGPCASCAAPTASESYFDLFGGYQCKSCGFIYACGTLTLGVPRLNQ